MHFHTAYCPMSPTKTLVLEHQGEQLRWVVSGFLATDRPDRVVRDINHYWSKIPQHRQQLIFDTYKDMHYKLHNIENPDRMHERLIEDFRMLMDNHPIEETILWAENECQIKYHPDIKEHYDDGFPKEITYVTSEYRALLALVLRSRPLLPLFAVYCANVKDSYGVQFKEYHAASILEDTDYVTSEAYERMFLYIRHHVENADRSEAAVLNSLGTVTLPDYVTAMAIVRKLTTCELPYKGEDTEPVNLVATLYNFVRSTLDGLNNKYGGAIRNKKPQDGNDNEPDNTSLPEGYKNRTDVTELDSQLYKVHTQNALVFARRIDSTVPEAYVDRCWAVLWESARYAPHPIQQTLVQWLVKLADLSPHAIPHLDAEETIKVFAAVKAVLWHWEYYDLAALISAFWKRTPEDTIYGSRRNPITDEQVEQLRKLFPYYQQLKGKTLSKHAQIQGVGKKEIVHNEAIRGIDAVVTLGNDLVWELNGPPELLEKTNWLTNPHGKVFPADIKVFLASLVIRINQ
jgi:hypothetical protein